MQKYNEFQWTYGHSTEKGVWGREGWVCVCVCVCVCVGEIWGAMCCPDAVHKAREHRGRQTQKPPGSGLMSQKSCCKRSKQNWKDMGDRDPGTRKGSRS